MSNATQTLPMDDAAVPAESDAVRERRYVNSRLWFVDADGFRTVFFCGLPLYRFGVDDRVPFKFVAVSLHQAGFARQEEIAEAFGIGVTTLRLWERQYEREGSSGLNRDRRGRPKKIDATLETAIRKLVAKGLSNREVARRVGVSEATVRNVLKRLGIERPGAVSPEIAFEDEAEETDESETAETDARQGDTEAQAADGCGVDSPDPGEGEREVEGEGLPSGLVTLDTDPLDRCLDRFLARLGMIDDAVPLFADVQRVPRVGVLLALPFFMRAGVLDVFMKIYRSLGPAFYGLRTTVVFLFLFALLRIKRPEHLKEHAPGPLGRILGLDRAPEVKTVRRKLKRLAAARRGLELMRALAKARADRNEARLGLLYVDGHVREYSGKYRLGKTKIMRRGRVGAAATDTWVSDLRGDPLFVVTCELNQKLTKMLEPVLAEVRQLVGDRKVTIVFDRGGFSPRLFARLAEDFHIITYLKGKKPRPLPLDAFETHEIEVDGKKISYRLHDAPCTKVGRIRSKNRSGPRFFWMRRVTCLREDGKQTHVLTTHTEMEPAWVLYWMFNRWRQENYFKYMREEFALDGLLEYGVEDITKGDLPNPEREKLKKKLGKVHARIADLLTALGAQAEDKEGASQRTMQGFRKANAPLRRELEKERKKVERLETKIAALPKRVPPAGLKALKSEVKLIGDAIKMTAYQTESELHDLLSPIYRRQEDEGRTFLHAAFQSAGEIQVKAEELRITLEPQSSPHRTEVLARLCDNLNALGTVFPGTSLRLRFAVVQRV